MGCCISKCNPKRQFIEDFSSHVHDKLVISQTPKTPVTTSNRISPLLPPLPRSPTSSNSSASYFTCSAATTGSTTSCLSKPGSSPALTSKDRSFSSEFLFACVKENPHIIKMNSIKEASMKLAMSKPQSQTLEPPPQAVAAKSSTPQRSKRVRSSSPTATTLARQKSFRRDTETANSVALLPSRTLRSPSPSRRFSNNGDKNLRGILASTERESGSKQILGSKVNALTSLYSTLARENSRTVSLMGDSVRPSLKNRETCVHRITSKIDEVAVGAALSNHQISESILLPEDFDNPLISLDCFIFL